MLLDDPPVVISASAAGTVGTLLGGLITNLWEL